MSDNKVMKYSSYTIVDDFGDDKQDMKHLNQLICLVILNFRIKLPWGCKCRQEISCEVCMLHNDSVQNSCVHAWNDNGCKRTCLKG